MTEQTRQLATLGGGCFWCIEAIFQQLSGVEKVVSGYSGGTTNDPDYTQVSSGQSGHAEVVQLTFDSNIISYQDIISIFMTSHDPSQINRQGADVGTQYRSVIFHHDQHQRQIAQSIINQIATLYEIPLATELTALERFYPAEVKHQDYYQNNANSRYCAVVIAPKLQKLRRDHLDKLRA